MPRTRVHNLNISLDGYAAGEHVTFKEPIGGANRLFEWFDGRAIHGVDGVDGPWTLDRALTSLWGQADLAAVQAAHPDAILLPKVERAADIAAAKASVPLWAMIETPLAILNVAEIAASGVTCLAMGTNDLLKAMQGQPLPDRRNLWWAMSQTVMAARAFGLSVLDGTHNEIDDLEGFAASCAQGRAFGFDGKTLIHPLQIGPCNRAFAPSREEIAQARRILQAFAANPGKGVIALDGRMIEGLHAEEARRLLALAEAIEGSA